jgi:hypothetical protein
MKKKFYTYGYLSPAPDNILYYIGKGKDNRAYNKNHRVPVPEDRDLIIFFNDDLTTYHKEPQYFTEEKAFDLEIKGIAKYGRMDLDEGYLLNRTDGGEGTSGNRVSEETKLKIGASVKANHGHKDGLKESHKDKIKKTMAGTRGGSDNPMHGRTHKESTRQKMREAWKTRERKKWICNEDGALLVPEKDPLPEGYHLGMIYRRASINTGYLDDLSGWDGPA